jgi:hypothetical protein
MIRARAKVVIWAGIAVLGIGFLDWADDRNRPLETVVRNSDSAEERQWDLKWSPAVLRESPDLASRPTSTQLPCEPSGTVGSGFDPDPEAATVVDPYAG